MPGHPRPGTGPPAYRTPGYAGWACHLRALAGCPTPCVLTPSPQRAGELDDPTADLVVTTALKVVELIDRLGLAYRTRAELIEDWHAVELLAADVPALAPMAGWLLDQIALRDAHVQQLRAVLEHAAHRLRARPASRRRTPGHGPGPR